MQPDTSAMDIADASPRQMMETAPAHTDKAVAYAEPSRAARFEALRMLAEREVTQPNAGRCPAAARYCEQNGHARFNG